MKTEICTVFGRIIINVPETGLYVFQEQGAEGKTRLCNLLREYAVPEIVVMTAPELHLENVSKDCRLVLIDRFDLVQDRDVISQIQKLSKITCIILDWKCHLVGVGGAAVVMTKGELMCIA